MKKRSKTTKREILDSIIQMVQVVKSTGFRHHLELPKQQSKVIHNIVAKIQQKVANKKPLNSTVLFTGLDSEGKTIASKVIANELNLDLYRIDLSQVVSKYIGETEKNLSQIFDYVASGAILLFEEADELFAKRNEIRDSHDRYANLEISYLMQRVSTFRGLVILATNHRKALNTDFQSLFTYVVKFTSRS